MTYFKKDFNGNPSIFCEDGLVAVFELEEERDLFLDSVQIHRTVNVYGADNKYHECTYIGKSPNDGHHIVYKNGKPWECAAEMIMEETK